MLGQIGFHFPRQYIALAAHGSINRPAHQQPQHGKQHPGIHPGNAAIQQLITRQQRDQRQHWQLFFENRGIQRDGAHDGDHPENQRNVGNIGAIGITQCQGGIAIQRGHGRHHHLWCRGAEADDQHADQQRRHTRMGRRTGRPFHKFVSTPYQHNQASDHGGNSQQHGDSLG